jgi:hypothetical protein
LQEHSNDRAGSCQFTRDSREIRAQHFNSLFDGLTGYIELRALRHGQLVDREFVSVGDIEVVERFIERNIGNDSYFGVAERLDGTSGKLENCGRLTALFTDIDYKDIAEVEARQRLNGFAYPPSIIIASGGGLHCYWRLDEPLDLAHEAVRAKRVLRKLAAALNADMSAAEPARVLRVPGTFNYKYDPPRLVEIVDEI